MGEYPKETVPEFYRVSGWKLMHLNMVRRHALVNTRRKYGPTINMQELDKIANNCQTSTCRAATFFAWQRLRFCQRTFAYLKFENTPETTIKELHGPVGAKGLSSSECSEHEEIDEEKLMISNKTLESRSLKNEKKPAIKISLAASKGPL